MDSSQKFPTTPVDPTSISLGIYESTIIALFAIVLGTLIDVIFKKINKKVDSKALKVVVAMAQIVFLGLVTTLIYLYLPRWFTDHFQTTFPGLLFPAMFYGVQSNIFDSMEQVFA
jgi:hypothetical protein